jgi:hypothetical protein
MLNRKHMGLVLALLILFVATGAQAATDKTYDLVLYGTSNYGITAGTITTDGTLGDLTMANIKSAETYADLYDYGNGTPYTNVGGTLYLEGALIATETELFLPYALPQTNLFEIDTGAGFKVNWETYSRFSFATVGIEINSSYEGYVLPPEDVVIATAEVPEPATMSLLALGGMAMLRRRKK